MNLRQQMEKRERTILSPHACCNGDSAGRERDEPECAIRMAFQRDRDRIIHCKAFRRLKHKTQVFLAPTGDHYRTRLTHVLEVAQIARTIAAALRLNEALTEAIALGHDLGHTPFGHAGESVLNELNPAGFRHYQQSLRVVDVLENNGAGLNLSWEVRDGIVKHSKGRRDILPEDLSRLPATLEGRVVRIADIIAYVNHDLDDAIRAGVITRAEVPASISQSLGTTYSQRINTMVSDLIARTLKNDDGTLQMSAPILTAITELRAFLYDNVYQTYTVHNDFIKAMKLLRELYHHMLDHPRLCDSAMSYQEDVSIHQRVTDFIAGMSDRYALDTYTELFLPKPWSVL